MLALIAGAPNRVCAQLLVLVVYCPTTSVLPTHEREREQQQQQLLVGAELVLGQHRSGHTATQTVSSKQQY